jgi:hypothetical protein
MKKERRNQPKKSISPLFLSLALILALVGLAIRVRFAFRHSIIASLSRVNLVIQTPQELLLLSLEGQEGLVWPLSADEKVKVPRGFGEYELAKVYALGELEKRGSQLLRETISEVFSVPVFGYFYSPQAFDDSIKAKPKALLKQAFWAALEGKIKTDLKMTDLALLYWRANRLSETLCRTIKPGAAKVLFQDRRLREEALSLEVLNATDHNGLAQQAGRLVEEAGGRVIRTADARENEAGCRLLTGEQGENYTAFWLASVFQCPLEKKEGENTRADLVLILGEEYWKKKAERW